MATDEKAKHKKRILNNKLTQKRLKEILSYDSKTGIFTRQKANEEKVKLNCKDSYGYIVIGIGYKLYKAHRLAYLYHYGYFPENGLDHKNRKRDDNRISNLREASKQCNIRNSGVSICNASGIKGVHWYKRTMEWAANIRVNRKKVFLGNYTNKLSAAYARRSTEVYYDWNTCDLFPSSANEYIKSKIGELR